MSNALYESDIEQLALEILKDEHDYKILYGPDISEGKYKEREYTEVILQGRLKKAVDTINDSIPDDAREEAIKKVLRTFSVSMMENNESFHRILTEGIDIKFNVGEGKSRTEKVWLIDFTNYDNNEFLAVNQFTIVENHNHKRPDIVLFINGIPLIVIELKNPIDENADVKAAFNQLQTYKQ
ncbi:truncated deoxyribonuclease [Candidatus Jettenia caeni]|uniref:type I site-specific deoxyribonuclease n=1 Tax=Candidatus Jettenia caeni TaxID=247490 RepID=I3IHK1_9BACT|nr:truncated deoxyribonuclease [Candidatus Jettenia caeni]